MLKNHKKMMEDKILNNYDFQDESYIPYVFMNNSKTIIICWCIADDNKLPLLNTKKKEPMFR